MRTSTLLVVAAFLFVATPTAAQNAQVLGTVRTAEGSIALTDMTVAAYNSSGFLAASTVTDSLGRYLLTLPPGTYRILAFDRSGTYATSFYKGASSFETSEAVNLSPGQSLPVNFALPPGLSMTGSVLDGATGAPLAGAVVAAYNADGSVRTFTTTGTTGVFTLIVPTGSYKLVAYHEVLPYVAEFFPDQRLFDSATFTTAPASGIVFTIELGVKVRGIVKEKGSGQPLDGLSVVAYDLQGNVRFRTKTSPSGEFSFGLPATSYKFATDDPKHIYQTTFFRDSTTFESAAVINVNGQSVPPALNFDVGRTPNPQAKTTMWVAAAANAPGANNTLFQTDVWIYNPSAEPVAITLTFLRGGQDNSSTTGLPVTIAARQQVYYRNILQTLFVTEGAGALRFESAAVFQVTSRTYNIPPNSVETGTFGLAIPGQSIGASLSRGTLQGLSGSAASRTNIGLLNPQPTSINVKLEIFTADGTVIRSENVALRPSEWIQLNNFVPAAENAYAVLTSADGSFFSYASVVDQKSGDGTIILPSAD